MAISVSAQMNQRLKQIDSSHNPSPNAYDDFAVDCRSAADLLAENGDFAEAFKVIEFIKEHDLIPDDDLLNPLLEGFYANTARQIKGPEVIEQISKTQLDCLVNASQLKKDERDQLVRRLRPLLS